MKLTKLQGDALCWLYRRAVRRAKLAVAPVGHKVLPSDIELSAGCGAQPDGEPYDLLKWSRMEGFYLKELLTADWPCGEFKGSVQLTPLGCQVAREMEER